MQRRAAAVYFALFVVVGAGAYGMLGAVSEPAVQLDGPTYVEGDQLSVGGTTYTVDSVGDGEVVLTYENETGAARETDAGEGENVTLGGSAHFAHFPERDGVQILPNDQYYTDYRSELDVQDHYHERRAGLWAVVILSFLAGIVLLATAYMPIRG
jgi:hypothetical protein